MAAVKPVSLANGAYIFCRTTIAALAWLAVLTQRSEFLWADFVILLASVILTVGRAPLILAYSSTIERIFPSRRVVMDEKAIRFAHGVGTVLCGVSLALLSSALPVAGWVVAVGLALLWTSAAFGYCSAAKVYQCATGSSSCCGIGKAVRKVRDVR